MKRFFALSRTSHGILDIGTPIFCALLWLGAFPSATIGLIGFATAFAAYTAVYALNDLAGYKHDKLNFSGNTSYEGYSVEASDFHHPIAQGVLKFKSGVYWASFWFIGALVGAYYLNPVIILILLGGAALEFIYCRLLKVTHLRVLVSGIVKACGPMAAVFAIDPSPSILLMLPLFSWVFFWEIGGQNIPADWNDVEEDKKVGAKTIPVRFGPNISSKIILAALLITVTMSLALPMISPLNLGVPYYVMALIIGAYFLLVPAVNLYRTKESRCAAKLFDRASYYPLALLVVIVAFIFLN